jgi:hypothetical protein
MAKKGLYPETEEFQIQGNATRKVLVGVCLFENDNCLAPRGAHALYDTVATPLFQQVPITQPPRAWAHHYLAPTDPSIQLIGPISLSLSLSLSLSPTHTQRTIAQRRDGQKMFFQLLVLTYYCNTSLQSLIFR